MLNDRPREQLLDLPEGDPHSTEHLDEQVQKAQEELASLRKRQDIIERQKRELEEMSKRQDQFTTSRADIVDKLARSIVVLEREQNEANRRIETLHTIHLSYRRHLELLESIDPKYWDSLDISKELTRALGAVDDASTEYSKSLPKISTHPAPDYPPSAYNESNGSENSERDLKEWFLMGLAFTSPLILAIVFAAILLASHK